MPDDRLQTGGFLLGQLNITVNASNVLDQIDVLRALERHATGDWGEVSKGDWQANEEAVKDGSRILSSYFDRNRKIFWVLTEADRSATTVMLPEDY